MRELLVRLSLIAVVAAGCTSASQRECERTADCANDEFCRMGFCVPAVAHDDAALNDTGATGRSAGDGGERPGPTDATERTAADTAQPPSCDGRAPTPGDLAVNEILVDVPSGSSGDANGDGTRDASADEFVELVNRADERLDLSNVELREDGETKTRLGPTCLAPRAALVVFGGGSVDRLTGSAGRSVFRVADSSLGFSNSGGRFDVIGSDGAKLATVQWDDPPGESLTLQPQIVGDHRRPHSTVAPSRKMSPGRCADGTRLREGCPASKRMDAGDAGDARDAGETGVGTDR